VITKRTVLLVLVLGALAAWLAAASTSGVRHARPIVPPPAALANAIHDAVGVRMRELPMSPGRLLKAILHKEGASVASAAAD